MDGHDCYGEKRIYDYATNSMERSLKEMRFFIAAKILKKFSFKPALEKVFELGGLLDVRFLFACYEKEFSKLSSENYAFEDDRYKAYSALWGLVMPGYLSVKIPISLTIRENATVGHPGLAPEHFTLTEIQPLEGVGVQLYTWNNGFEKYFSDIEKIESGESDISLSDLNFENPYRLRFDITESIVKDLTTKISEMLKQPVKDSVETIERNLELRLLITEVGRWPYRLQYFVRSKLKGLKKEKVKDEFARLILNFLSETDYPITFDVKDFNQRILDFYWTELFALTQDEGQKKILETIKLEVEALTNVSNSE